jgi:hypothetical protein
MINLIVLYYQVVRDYKKWIKWWLWLDYIHCSSLHCIFFQFNFDIHLFWCDLKIITLTFLIISSWYLYTRVALVHFQVKILHYRVFLHFNIFNLLFKLIELFTALEFYTIESIYIYSTQFLRIVRYKMNS